MLPSSLHPTSARTLVGEGQEQEGVWGGPTKTAQSFRVFTDGFLELSEFLLCARSLGRASHVTSEKVQLLDSRSCNSPPAASVESKNRTLTDWVQGFTRKALVPEVSEFPVSDTALYQEEILWTGRHRCPPLLFQITKPLQLAADTQSTGKLPKSDLHDKLGGKGVNLGVQNFLKIT